MLYLPRAWFNRLQSCAVWYVISYYPYADQPSERNKISISATAITSSTMEPNTIVFEVHISVLLKGAIPFWNGIHCIGVLMFT